MPKAKTKEGIEEDSKIEETQSTESPVDTVLPEGDQAVIAAIESMNVEMNTERPVREGKKFPSIIAGICEFCGEHASKCGHYANKRIQCFSCGEQLTGRKDDVLEKRRVQVVAFNDTPNMLTMVCDNFSCNNAFQKRVGTLAKDANTNY